MPEPNRPEWLETVEQALFAVPEGHRTTCIRVNGPIQTVIRAAAKARGMSESAYMRRAAVAIACHDLGLDWNAVMADEPPFAPYGRSAGKAPLDMKGAGFGPWGVQHLVSTS